jgi:small subunit ribosomal protein S6
MSRKYQGLIVLNTKSLEGSVDDLVSSVSKELQAEGAKIEKVAQLGRREFAYETRHLQSGHYVNYTFEGAPDTITKIRNRLKLNGHVHLQHFSRIA